MGISMKSTTQLAKKLAKVLPTAPDHDHGFSAIVGGDAAAYGDDTLAKGRIKTVTKENNHVIKSKGKAVFKAKAHDDQGDALAEANAYADVDGADLVVYLAETVHKENHQMEKTKVKLKYFAVDLVDIDFATGPIELYLSKDTGIFGGRGDGNVDGHVAAISAEALAIGGGMGSLSDTVTSAIVFELASGDGFSAVDGYALTAIA